MFLEALLKSYLGSSVETKAAPHWSFADGRSAKVLLRGRGLGHIGEISPHAIASFGLEVPVSGFEIDLSQIVGPDS